MKLIVCLGNPGQKYRYHRHNVGFMMGEWLVDQFQLTGPKTKHKSQVWRGQVEGVSVNVMLPQTFMNESGKAVQQAVAFYKLDVRDVLIIYDDFELAFGTVRIRQAGSAGTHNGMRSILGCLGSLAVPRLRIGIGPKEAFMETAAFVLSNFTALQQQQLTHNRAALMCMVSHLCQDAYQAAQQVRFTDDSGA